MNAVPMRCAVYTRKSTDEGLDQAFNSLDAQYEACASYVMSQRHEGWSLVANRYDDGGLSGGTMERPALKRLLADVLAGRVQVIVVYKVDRLTRSLADFAKIVDVLDASKASFVSVTQAFNTTTSMGRLTLNVLLSFAQFEREVTAERIRDKVAASKAKGIWMGGPVPLGYRVEARKLLPHLVEAKTVVNLFERYLAVGSGNALVEELASDGVVTALRCGRGGLPFGKAALFHLLGNRVYVGDIVHKGTAYAGEHPGIVDPALFDAVQARIAAASVKRKARTNVKEPSLLVGKLFDRHGRNMSPSHAVKQGRRYRYYVTHGNTLTSGGPSCERVPAGEVERRVVGQLLALMRDGHAVSSLVEREALDATRLQALVQAAAMLAEQLASPTGQRTVVPKLIDSVGLSSDALEVLLDRDGLAQLLGLEGVLIATIPPLVASVVKVRAGKDVRLVIGTPGDSRRDDKLVALLREAHRAQGALFASYGQSLKQVALAQGACRHRFAKLIRVAQLAPTLTLAILDGRQPVPLTARGLLDAELPLGWGEQARVLGFAG